MGNELKIGDRVRIIDQDGYYASTEQGLVVGNTGTVVRLAEVGVGALKVRTDNASEPTDGGGVGWSFSPEALEKLES